MSFYIEVVVRGLHALIMGMNVMVIWETRLVLGWNVQDASLMTLMHKFSFILDFLSTQSTVYMQAQIYTQSNVP